MWIVSNCEQRPVPQLALHNPGCSKLTQRKTHFAGRSTYLYASISSISFTNLKVKIQSHICFSVCFIMMAIIRIFILFLIRYTNYYYYFFLKKFFIDIIYPTHIYPFILEGSQAVSRSSWCIVMCVRIYKLRHRHTRRVLVACTPTSTATAAAKSANIRASAVMHNVCGLSFLAHECCRSRTSVLHSHFAASSVSR